MGLAAVAVGMKRITPQMFARAAEVLSTCVTKEYLDKGMVYPDVSDIRHVSIRVATEICNMAYNEKLASVNVPEGMTLERYLESIMYRPVYQPYVSNK
jgi:malic enzyme